MPETQCMPALGSPAPNFTATTTQGPLSLSDLSGKWVVLFSHPGDFTPICTTEFMAFAQAYPQFEALGAQLLGLSIDSNPSHIAWVLNIYRNTSVMVPFPIIADQNAEIARSYGMLSASASSTQTVRTVFMIDPQGIVRASLNYPLTTGRCIEEILRLLQALQAADETHLMTPACWREGDPMIYPPPATVEEARKAEACPDRYCVDWYLCYNKPPLISKGPGRTP
ncbi:MAG: peroxiredoxin [Eubacteriales bacterium]|nr:peroxiredoxin [Eubacteriales bacterium]